MKSTLAQGLRNDTSISRDPLNLSSSQLPQRRSFRRIPLAEVVALLLAAFGQTVGPSSIVAAESPEPVWKERAVGSNAPPVAGGPVWLRAWLRVPDNLTGESGPDLWRDSMVLSLSAIPGPVVVWLNGQKIIETRDLPPSPPRRFKVPKGILQKGNYNALILRLDAGRAPHALLEPPSFAGYFDEVRLERPWQITFSAPSEADLRATATHPSSAAVYGEEDFRPATTVMTANPEPERGLYVSPADALAKLRTEPDLVVEGLLHEPQVAQPTQLSFDERGRMWVAQYRQYPYPAGLTMISRDKYYRSKYDRIPPPPPNQTPGADIISVHEDCDGDGAYETHRQVLTGLNLANAVLRGHGGIWVMNPPYLLFYPDANGDDVPDRPPEVRLQGFGLEDTHSVANGLAWGPDGWIYGAQGSTTTSRVTRPGVDPPDASGTAVEGCMVWRYHPRLKLYEIFADGSGNTFGISFDSEGRLFTGHNGGDTRGWHHVQEGQYLKQGKDPGKFGPAPNPYAYGEMPMMRSTHPIPRFTHMTILAEGTALPGRWRGRFFGVDPLHHQVIAADRRTVGSTFETTDCGIPLRTDDLTFRPVYLANAPDGSVVIADFREEYIAHGQNYQSQIDPTTGRIYRLRGRELPRERDVDLSRKSIPELVALLSHPNIWHRQTAVRLLAERNEPSAVPLLQVELEKTSVHPALEALWALHQLGALNADLAGRALLHPVAAVRGWTVRLLGDARVWPASLEESLLTLAASEPDAEVRCQLLSTARRLPARQALPVVRNVARGTNDVDDPFIPLMTWFVVESHCATNREAVLALFTDPTFWTAPLVHRHLVPRLMRRWADAGSRQDLLTCARLLRLAPGDAERQALLRGFEEAYRGRSIPALPDELVQALADSGRMTLLFRVRQGEPAALEEAMKELAQGGSGEAPRIALVRIFGEVKYPPAVPLLLRTTLLEESIEMRVAACTALQLYDDPNIADQVCEAWSQLPPEVQRAALNLLSSRPAWSKVLLEFVSQGRLPGSVVSPDLRSRLARHGDPVLMELLQRQIPAPAEPSAADTRSQLEKVRRLITIAPGDPYRGEAVFLERCATCHTLFFKGGRIGPDLTSYQRDDLGTLLPSILDPNAAIREGFENVLVTTRDGRALNGFLADQDTHVVVVRGFDGADVQLRREDIVTLEPAGRSLMPEGLLDGLNDDQIRDFFAYLRQSQPITK
ncbi:MAG TPA: dehydrogenase [Verrucomicrobiales bacterium]|nr:dehydrogenase [Verrucomicrobiales bacterium]